MRLTKFPMITLGLCAALCFVLFGAIGSGMTDTLAGIVPLAEPSFSAMAVPSLIGTMPVKMGGKVYPTGKPLPEIDDDEFDELKASGVVREATADELATADAPDLADRLQELISEGIDIGELNMKDTIEILGDGFEKTKRADVKAALELIKVNN